MTKIALIWASSNPDKFWNKILLDLVKKWYVVYPVNPKNKEINWIRTFEQISDITDKIDIVNFVVKPEITMKILEKHKDFLLKKQIWCQLWSSNESVKKYLKKYKFKNYILGDCIMKKKVM